MSAAVSGLRADAHLPWPVVEAHVWTALALALGQKAAVVERTAGATHQHVLLGRKQDRLQIDFSAGHTVFEIMNRAKRSVERMPAVQHQPAREIALDYVGVAVTDVLASRDVQMRARHQREIDAALETAELERGMAARAW